MLQNQSQNNTKTNSKMKPEKPDFSSLKNGEKIC